MLGLQNAAGKFESETEKSEHFRTIDFLKIRTVEFRHAQTHIVHLQNVAHILLNT
jgi:hypothetical protein